MAAYVFVAKAQPVRPNPLLTGQSAWQQTVDHDIEVRLDEKQKVLQAQQTVTYTNQSPVTLNEIWFHIWPKAFSSRTSAYGKEAVVKGNKRFYDLKPADAGNLDSLSFTVNGLPATFTYHPEHIDIIKLALPAPLKSGEVVVIKTPFRVKIPFLFSRMGVDDDLFSITQWYPKPAVYDVNGWNVFPYAEQGEYYSEFGTYKVKINVPADFKVASTGVLQDTAEMEWLDEVAGEGAETELRGGRKEITYVQSNVCDFAWFASFKFKVFQDQCVIQGGKTVKTHAFYTGENTSGKSITDAISKALTYYSSRVGPYPYDHCSVVVGALKAAGGMEYPMVTICASASEETIVHEVGHNWFQGILGSQERDYPWMDESVNSFYENQTMGSGSEEISPGDKLSGSQTYIGFRLIHDLGSFQEGNLHSQKYTDKNYGAVVYGINPRHFVYLQEYLGRKTFDTCMKTYFKNWKFKHPLPSDMQKVFEEVSKKQLDWFFKGLLGSSTPDFAIQSVKKTAQGYRVKIKNKGSYPLPVKLQWRFAGKQKDQVWVNGDTSILVPLRAEQIALNPTGFLAESNLANNDAQTKGILKTWGKTKFALPNVATRGENRAWFLPWLFAWNKHDGWMPGLILSNISAPRRNWEWWATPMYGVKSNEITGFAGIRRNRFHKSGPLALTEISSTLKRFSFYAGIYDPNLSAYNRMALNATTYLKRNKPWVKNQLTVEYLLLRMDRTGYNAPLYSGDSIVGQGFFTDGRRWESDLLRFSWVRESNKKFLPFRTRLNLLYGGNRGKLSWHKNVLPGDFMIASGDLSLYIPYPGIKRTAGLRLKGYASAMLMNNFPFSNSGRFVIPVSAPQSNPNDFSFSNTTYMRSAQFGSGNGAWSNHLVADMNGIRMFPNINSNKAVVGMSAETSIIPGLPLNLFLDAAYAPNINLDENLLYAGGICYTQYLGHNCNFEVSLPLMYSNTFKNYVSANPDLRFYHFISFRASLDLSNPFSIARTILE